MTEERDKINVEIGFNKNNIIFVKAIKECGNGGHIYVPVKYAGKQAVIIISETQFENVEDNNENKKNKKENKKESKK